MEATKAKQMTPKYYIGTNGIEAFDVIEGFQPHNYNIGTAITYLLRAGKKKGNPTSQDIAKAIAHLQRELKNQSDVREQQSTEATNRQSSTAGCTTVYELQGK
tara:strand:+ start:931 stop:1239 length:309 start_codon:yes stop_codon:yes gene_type:complete